MIVVFGLLGGIRGGRGGGACSRSRDIWGALVLVWDGALRGGFNFCFPADF